MGPSDGQQAQLKILNRIVTWDGTRGLVYEADPRHVEIVIEQLGFQEAKPVATSGTKDEGRTQKGMEIELKGDEASKYRALVARCNYLAPDRPDIAYSVKELARQMSNPTVGDWYRLKRLGRYLKGQPRMQQIFKWQQVVIISELYSDPGEEVSLALGWTFKQGQHSIDLQ